jgi:hypothetical protein
MYDDSERCPSCGDYVVRRSNIWHGKPWWWVVLGVAGVLAVIWLLGLAGILPLLWLMMP